MFDEFDFGGPSDPIYETKRVQFYNTNIKISSRKGTPRERIKEINSLLQDNFFTKYFTTEQKKKNLTSERNCLQSFKRQLYPPINHKKTNSIIEQMQDNAPDILEKKHRNNIIYRVQYKLIQNHLLDEECIKESYSIDWESNSINLYATEKLTPIGAIIKGEKFTLKQLYNKRFMKRRMQAINKAIRQRLLMEQKIIRQRLLMEQKIQEAKKRIIRNKRSSFRVKSKARGSKILHS